jgi:hypothetical protein
MIDKLFATDALVFTVPALAGTLFFVLRLAVTIVGLDIEGADGGGDDFGAGMGDGAGGLDAGELEQGVDHAETASVFKFVSILTVTAFFMGFGWGGLVAMYPMGLDAVPSVVFALGIGVALAWFVIWLLKLLYSFESSGNITIEKAYGCEGVTTSTIPAQNAGTGRVRITIKDRQRAYAARTEGEAIRMGAQIRVTRVNRDNSLTVVPT